MMTMNAQMLAEAAEKAKQVEEHRKVLAKQCQDMLDNAMTALQAVKLAIEGLVGAGSETPLVDDEEAPEPRKKAAAKEPPGKLTRTGKPDKRATMWTPARRKAHSERMRKLWAEKQKG